MKKSYYFWIAALLLSLLIIKTSCKDKAPAGYSTHPPAKKTIYDTAKLILVFVDPSGQEIRHDIGYRIRVDSVKTLVPLGDGKFNEYWFTDSQYYLPKLDTLRDSTRHPIKGADGNYTIIPVYPGPYSKEIVWDENIVVDSAVRKFQRFLTLPDTTKKKPQN